MTQLESAEKFAKTLCETLDRGLLEIRKEDERLAAILLTLRAVIVLQREILHALKESSTNTGSKT